MVNPVIRKGCIDNSDRSMEAIKIPEDNIGIENHSPCEDTYIYKDEYEMKSIGKSIALEDVFEVIA